MHQGRPHQGFDPTMALPKEGWMSYQGIPHEYPTEGAPLELTLAYGGEEEPQFGPLKEGYAFPEQAPGLLESLPDPDFPHRAQEQDPDDDTLWRQLRRLVEPETLGETGALVGLGMIPGPDIAIDLVDLAAAIEDKDLPRAMWATAGLGLPIAGASLKELVGSIKLFRRNAPKIEGTRLPHQDQPNPIAPTPRTKPTELSERWANSEKVQDLIDEQVEAGIDVGGEKWYETGGILERMPENSPGMSFDEFNIIGAATSPRSPVDLQLMKTSIVNFARQNDISIKEAQKIYSSIYPNAFFRSPYGLERMLETGLKQADEGYLAPMAYGKPSPGKGNWKTPSFDNALSGKGSLDVNLAGGNVPMDVHEGGSANWIIQQIPELRKAALGLKTPYRGGVPDLFDTSKFSKNDYFFNPEGTGLLTPNAPSYQNFSRPYVRSAKKHGLPTGSSAQGARWEGGRVLGISIPETPPGTFQSITERAIREANQISNLGFGNIDEFGIGGGYDDTAEGLLQYFQEMREGKRFLPQSVNAAPWMR